MLVLGIETSCDETACAVVQDGKKILSNIVSSQIDLHKEYGGVVPELACRRHIDLMIPVLDQALKEASIQKEGIDLIAVAHGPGLIGALLIGLNTAKGLALALQKPFIGVNHIEAHLYAAIMDKQADIAFPALGVVLSGGHTALILINGLGHYELIGQTVDDAIGEAFDKAAKMVGLPYPGGPQIEQLALKGNPHRYPFKGGHVKANPFDFSFSGLKTAVLYTLQKEKNFSSDSPPLLEIDDQEKRDIAASFQRAAFEDVLKKTLLAAKLFQVKTVIFGGGVTNNQNLKDLFKEKTAGSELELLWPSIGLSLDNAAMIAGLGYDLYQRKGKGDSMDLEPLTRIPFILHSPKNGA